jgi:hypothetical protein
MPRLSYTQRRDPCLGKHLGELPQEIGHEMRRLGRPQARGRRVNFAGRHPSFPPGILVGVTAGASEAIHDRREDADPRNRRIFAPHRP